MLPPDFLFQPCNSLSSHPASGELYPNICCGGRSKLRAESVRKMASPEARHDGKGLMILQSVSMLILFNITPFAYYSPLASSLRSRQRRVALKRLLRREKQTSCTVGHCLVGRIASPEARDDGNRLMTLQHQRFPTFQRLETLHPHRLYGPPAVS